MTDIPNLSFRIEPGFNFTDELLVPTKFESNNILIGNSILNEKTKAILKAIFIGKVAEYGKNMNCWLDIERAHAIYVMGKRRSGKTYTLGALIEGLASKQWIKRGEENQAILVIDTMNVFITMPHGVMDMSEKRPEVDAAKKWGLGAESFEIVQYYPKGTSAPPEGVTREITLRPADLDDKDWASLFGFDTYSDPMGQLIAELYEKVALEGYQDENDNLVNKKEDYLIHDFLECMDNSPDIQHNYHPDTIRGVRARFKAINRQPVFSETGVPVHDLFSPGKISLLLLRDLDQNLRALLVGVLVKKIMTLRSVSHNLERLAMSQKNRYEGFLERGDSQNANEALEKYNQYTREKQNGLPRGWIIIDEAHNYLPTGDIVPSADPLRKYVNEGRNLGLSIVVATQNPSALDPSIRRNSDILIIHSMSMRDDISVAEGMLNTKLPESFEFGREKITTRIFEQLVRSLPIGYAAISNEVANRLFVIQVRPRVTVHGGAEY